MFDAVIAKKARMSKILHDAKRNPREDLVTSSLFGVLPFLTPAARQEALSVLCGHPLPSDAKIYLWPFFVGNGESSEPDVVLEFTHEGRAAYWIVEVKWGAPLGADQCAREIRTLSFGRCRRGGVPPGPRKVLGYTLLGAERHHELAVATLHEDARSGKLKAVPAEGIRSLKWTTAGGNLRLLEAASFDPGLKAWAGLSANFIAGQPQGAVLRTWPKMTPPGRGGFAFDGEEKFALPSMTYVQKARYEFGDKQ
ncbi:hypothetical protein V8J36_22620 [Frigidibacter sp. MR17.14]|uniref:hypothetical protein n=1 Tax=Frigidibacter sp. MR17.14 TaxID=3126509 RepID=UPI003012D212